MEQEFSTAKRYVSVGEYLAANDGSFDSAGFWPEDVSYCFYDRNTGFHMPHLYDAARFLHNKAITLTLGNFQTVIEPGQWIPYHGIWHDQMRMTWEGMEKDVDSLKCEALTFSKEFRKSSNYTTYVLNNHIQITGGCAVGYVN